jgi:hypothetical protein
MIATNHAITGALIGLIVGEPLLAIPAAILSHFVCDSLPHYGNNSPDTVFFKSKTFRNMLITDAALCVVLVIILALTRPEHWFLASICAFLSTSPDLIWINHFRLARADKQWYLVYYRSNYLG